MISQFINNAFMFCATIESGRSDWKERILADWQKTFSMPRKMKKQRRKSLQLDWQIANYDPFNHF